MNRKILAQMQCLIVVLFIVFSGADFSFAQPESLDIVAPSAILIESQRGQILYQKNSKQRLHISSANKIMTALITLEKMKDQLDTKVTISKNAASVEGATLNLEVGEKYSVEDLLYSVILDSVNDSAIALAEHIGGDEKGFVELMNKRAKELQMVDTNFTNATGLYDEQQYTTAYDIALLVRHAITKSSKFQKIFSSKAWPWANDGKVLINSNELFWSYDGVDGGKTGYNEIERQTAITTATRNGQRLIAVVLDSPQGSVYDDSIKILDYGFENFRTGTLVANGETVKSIPVGDEMLDLIALADYYYTYPIGENYIKDFDISLQDNLEPPIRKNEVLGVAKYTLDDGTVIEVNLYPANEVYSTMTWFSSLMSKFSEYKDIVILIAILLTIEVFLLLLQIVRLIKRIFIKLFSKAKN
ncbi:MAG TPA: D-alanyl-D-alanine carboxypeptidase family protein [Acetivibrio sp.]|nr:D-alanyl-D-alanine carboxypeptidase family protein [Acetivibrio sp.]HPT91840.1 D-alanyl-D-alanine carboxypeptidase family protein [Acetivibrio sp.]